MTMSAAWPTWPHSLPPSTVNQVGITLRRH
jgi:hypothetical protein